MNVPKEMRETYTAIIKLADGFASRMEKNPRAWLIRVNGLTVDARRIPKELQEIACQKGLIPYVPDDGPDET